MYIIIKNLQNTAEGEKEGEVEKERVKCDEVIFIVEQGGFIAVASFLTSMENKLKHVLKN